MRVRCVLSTWRIMNLFESRKYLLVLLFLYLSTFLKADAKVVDEVKYSEQECNEQVDVYLLLDGSGSIGHRNWVEGVIPMLNGLVNNLNISKGVINLSLALFSFNTTELIRLRRGASVDKKQALDLVNELGKKYSPRGSTNLSSALRYVIGVLGDRENRPDAVQLVIILTDGVPNSPNTAVNLVKYLKEKNVKVAVIGVGAGIDDGYNKILSGCAAHDPVCPFYSHADWDAASTIIKPFLQKVCIEVQKVANCGEWGEWSECSVTCGTGTKSRSRDILHKGCTGNMTAECVMDECPVVPAPIPIPVPLPVPEDKNPSVNDDDDFPNQNQGLDVPDELENDIPPPEDLPEERPPRRGDVPDDFVPDEEVLPEAPANVPEERGNDVPEEFPQNPENEQNVPEKPNDLPIEQEKPQDDGNNKVDYKKNDMYKPEKGGYVIENDHRAPKPSNSYSDSKGKAQSMNYSSNQYNNIPEERYPKPHKSIGRKDNSRNNYPSAPYTPEEPTDDEYANKGKKKSNNGYKIAGGIIGGLALVGCVGFAYNFVSHGASAALTPESAPFDDVLPEDEKDMAEQEQFKLPEENDWN
ncbi:thrombospondin-related anonymous protein (TRAP) [Plasmodium ovale wallikeri]|uniref:Thrombospondin-related anonymous protein (TRAP) n=1 Tax=Plasmodium ovale wallikeri TaxID=864142 RepID=A0A1A8ZA40_PLAOA|nr:thrombospondin-related anonymous protein (TRAP) [Plasmodium ovale wallikeri]SBT41017.1 thrombospondin-related anonymous protein (TRAP) [Plasmodium ovale wallikeri]